MNKLARATVSRALLVSALAVVVASISAMALFESETQITFDSDSDPAFSPDGSKIAFTSFRGGLLPANTTPKDLLISSFFSNQVLRYDGQTGAFIGVFASGGGLFTPTALDFGPDGNLYVASFQGTTGSVFRYNGQTGAFIDVVVPSAGGVGGMVFGPDGNLYVSIRSADNVQRYDGQTGAFIDVFASGSGLDSPGALDFGPDGNLYVGSDFSRNSDVLRYDGQTGVFIDVFTSASANCCVGLRSMIFGPDENLYIPRFFADDVVRHDGQTGVFIDAFVPVGSGGLEEPWGLTFGPDGNLYVGSHETSTAQGVLRYDGQTGAFIDAFAGGTELVGPSGLVFIEPPPPDPRPGPRLYEASLILHDRANDATNGAVYPYSAPVFIARPLGARCNAFYPGGATCADSILQQGAPLTGSGTLTPNTMTSPPGFTLATSALFIDTTGSLPRYVPYYTALTDASNLRNAAGSFAVGGGPGSRTFGVGIGPHQAIARVRAGANKFGGTMRILGRMSSSIRRFTPGLGKQGYKTGTVTSLFGVLGSTLSTTRAFQYYWTRRYYSTTAFVTAVGVGWTTGTVSVEDTLRDPFPTSAARKGYDNRSVYGAGTIQLVTPLIAHWELSGSNPNRSSGMIGILRLKFIPEPAGGLLLIAGIGFLGVLYRWRAR